MSVNIITVIRAVTDSGVKFVRSKADRRNIVLANYIALVSSCATIFLLIGRALFATVNASIFFTLFLGTLLFLIPILLNRYGLIRLSRIALCWLPALYQVFASVKMLEEAKYFETSMFLGVRFFQVAFSCFPFLVFDVRKIKMLLVGLSVPMICLLLFDPILSWVGYGYYQTGLHELTYDFSNVRIALAMMIIGSSCYFLKALIERADEINDNLLAELAEKNKLITRQAQTEVFQLNEQLQLNLEQLRKREFILKQSQRIAKVGSWDYRIADKAIFWSDEMYNIFGLDHSFDLKTGQLTDVLWGVNREIMLHAMGSVLKHGQSFDLTLQTRTPLGYSKWVRAYGFPVRNSNDEIIGASGICHDVTVFKEAEELVRAQEKKYRGLFEQASDPILVTDFSGHLTDVNTALCHVFGYTREELLGMHVSELIDPENLKQNPISFQRLQRGEHMLSERPMVHKNGARILVEANVKKSGENRIMAIVREVTELRVVQRQVLESEARFRGAFEDSAIGMALVSIEGKWMKVNRAFCQMTGYSEEELLRLSFQDIDHAEDIQPDLDIIKRITDGERGVFQLEKRYIHKNGSIIWANLNVSVVRQELVPLYFVAQIEDITEERKAMEKLILSEANLNATINNTEILIWSVDRELNLLTFNKAFFDHMKTRYGTEIKVGERILAGLPPGSVNELDANWNQRYLRALAGEIVSLEETRFGIDFKYSISPIIENKKVIGASVFADNITEKNQRERDLTEAQRKIGELKLMALRSVMNPHFVFNVLNSIQYYIAKNDRMNAINYLSTFSKLIRSVLSHSVNNKVKLSEEIDMLKNYVQLEMTRFENKFDFNLIVEDGVDVDTIEIPPLLVQPYVENAILHGLYNKRSQGALTIRIKEQNDVVLFEIEDNGIGREEARKIRQKNLPNHKSMGINLTEERLRLINEAHNVAFNIDDLSDSTGATGTKVTIGVKF